MIYHASLQIFGHTIYFNRTDDSTVTSASCLHKSFPLSLSFKFTTDRTHVTQQKFLCIPGCWRDAQIYTSECGWIRHHGDSIAREAVTVLLSVNQEHLVFVPGAPAVPLTLATETVPTTLDYPSSGSGIEDPSSISNDLGASGPFCRGGGKGKVHTSKYSHNTSLGNWN